MTSQRKSIEPIAVDTTFESRTPKPLPAEHIRSPSLVHQSSAESPQPVHPPKPAARRLKSASISQPARPAIVSKHRHAASTAAPIPKSLDALEEEKTEEALSKEPNFLTLLAAQERKVLEIKEELQKAEDELRKLKKEWASHESSKRRNEGRRLHQMRPMSTASARLTAWKDDPDGSSAWMYEEMERRKALMGRGRRTSRRVFTGSRTPRPLSLVATSNFTLPELADDRHSLDERPTRRQTTIDLVPEESDRCTPTSFYRSASSSPQRQSLYLGGGKQLASEWREGLWTFFEDLRHATVGEESRGGQNTAEAQPKRASTIEAAKQRPRSGRESKGSDIKAEEQVKRDSKGEIIDVNGLLYSTGSLSGKDDEGPTLSHPTPVKPSKRSKNTPPLPLHTRIVDGEAWETWDSPDAKQPSSAHSSNNSISAGNVSPSPQISTPASSTTTLRESVPWPALNKLAPGNIRRTASHLMDEWERSLLENSDRRDDSRGKLFSNDDSLSPPHSSAWDD